MGAASRRVGRPRWTGRQRAFRATPAEGRAFPAACGAKRASGLRIGAQRADWLVLRGRYRPRSLPGQPQPQRRPVRRS
jgi:hypothetical protein